MQDTHDPLAASLVEEVLDSLEQAGDADTALQCADEWRHRIAGPGVFSVQQNVTRADHAPNEIRLRRFYSSEAQHYPVNGSKRKTLTPWTECLFLRGQVFIGEGPQVLASHFDDYERMRHWGLQSVLNVPLMRGRVCYATFNVFGVQAGWQPHQVLGIRLLALATARWVPAAVDLCYRLKDASIAIPQES